MPKSGPARTPTNILKLRGSWRADDRGDADLPSSVKGSPPCPDWLGVDAAAVWRRLVPQFEALGVLAVTDENALARYCILWVQWKELTKFIEEHGYTYESVTTNGGMKLVLHPNASMLATITGQLLRLEQDFGMTPSSRSNLDVRFKDIEEDALTAIQNRKKDRVTG